MAVAADKGRLEDDPGIPVYRKGENGGPDDLGAYEWLFGYRTPAQVAKIPYGEYIEPFRGVFLDEVV